MEEIPYPSGETLSFRTFVRPACLAVFMLILAGCAFSRATAQAPAAAEVTRLVIHDAIEYRDGGNPAWRLDLAMTEGSGPELRPALVIVHGGGWNAGSRRSRPYRRMLTEFALDGYVTISIDYRFLREAQMPEIVEDVRCAVRWLRAHAAEYGVDPERIGAFGHSAGAHLALMLAIGDNGPTSEGDCEWNAHASSVAAIAGGSTPTDLPARFGDAARFSPANHVSSEMPPLLLIHGTADPIVPVGPVDAYVEALRDAGAPDVTYIRIDEGDHDVAYDDSMEQSMDSVTEFFARTLGR